MNAVTDLGALPLDYYKSIPETGGRFKAKISETFPNTKIWYKLLWDY